MRSISKALALAIALALAAPAGVVAQAGDPVVGFDERDEEMAEAMAQARRTVDAVIERLESQDALGALALRVAIPKDGGGAEHIYVDQITRLGDQRFEGALANRPADLPGMAFGDRYAFSHDQISDWVVDDGNLIHGAYTLRVMLPRMSPDEAEQLRPRLAPLPGQ